MLLVTKSKKVVLILFAISLFFMIIMATDVFASSTSARVGGLKATKVTSKTVTLKWKKVDHAKKYCVYYSAGSNYKLAGKTSNTSYRIKKLAGNKDYRIKVRAQNGKKKGKFSKTVKVKTLCRVTFVYKKSDPFGIGDYDTIAIKRITKSVKRGRNVTAPKVGSYKDNDGIKYVFEKWNKSLKNINGNTTITVRYKPVSKNFINSHQALKKKAYSAIDSRKAKVFVFSKKGKLATEEIVSPYASIFAFDGDKIPYSDYYKYTIDFEYNCSKKQQAQVKRKINSLVKSLTGSDTEKVIKFNSWICANCKYDSSLTKYAGCDVFIYRKAVCQGISEAACGVLEKAGVDIKYICGYKVNKNNNIFGGLHSWNVVKIDGKWYSCDFTWNLGRTSNGVAGVAYLLKGTNNKRFWNTHKIGKGFDSYFPKATNDLI